MFRLATHLVRICEKQQVVEPEVDNRSQASNFSSGSLTGKENYTCFGMRDEGFGLENCALRLH